MTITVVEETSSKIYNVVFVGSGASTSYSLIAMSEQLSRSETQPIKVLVVEQSGEFNKGVAYGQRSGEKALILTRIDQFYPASELEKFAAWVKTSGKLKEIWANHSDEQLTALENLPEKLFLAEFGRMCVRRSIVGQFIDWRVDTALNSAHTNGALEVDFIDAQVLGVHRNQDANGVMELAIKQVASTTHCTVSAENVILAIGTRPRLAVDIEGELPEYAKSRLVSDPYDSAGLDNNLKALVTDISANENDEIDLTVLGSNASAMETLYMLSTLVSRCSCPVNITVLSMLGELPAMIPEIIDDTCVSVPEIDRLAENDVIDSDGLYKAALDALKRLKIEGCSVDCYNRSVDVALLSALEKMKVEDRLEFLRSKGNALGRYKRRAERNYFDNASSMLNSSRLKLVTGRMNSLQYKNDKFCAEIMLESGETASMLSDGLINCGTTETLSEKSSNPLIASMIESGMVSVDNSASCLITTDGGFGIAENVYVIGPLLAGNIVGEDPVWHLEHCGRIIHYSAKLAQQLLAETKAPIHTDLRAV